MTTILKSAVLGAVAAWLAVAPASAQDDPRVLGFKTEQALAAGNTLEALDLAGKFSQAVWDAAPLAFRKAVLIDGTPAGFGQYTARANDVYGVDEEIHIYVEPVAFGWRPAGDGFETDLVADVRLSSKDGKIIAAHKAFSEFKIDSRTRNPDTFLTLTYVFGGLGKGDYVVTTTLDDRVGNKSGAFSIPITIR